MSLPETPDAKSQHYLAENAAAPDLEPTTGDLSELTTLPAPVGARE